MQWVWRVWPGKILLPCSKLLCLIDSTSSTNIRPRARPIARSKSIKPTDDNDTYVLSLCVASISDITCLCSIDISSGDDAMSVKSSKSTKRYWFFSLPVYLLDLLMSNQCNVDWWGMDYHPSSTKVGLLLPIDSSNIWCSCNSRSIVPKTPVSSRTSSVWVINILFICCFYWPVCIWSNRKRSVSLMVSPITDEESIEYVAFRSVFVYSNVHFSRMMPSPTKSVRFQKDISSAPLKGVLKKPEVVIPMWVECSI